MHLVRGALRATAVALLAAAALVGGSAPALAHPFGPPPTALLTARGHEVLIDWRSAVDDAAAIGVALGHFDESVLDAYLEASTQVAPPAADEEAFVASPALRSYLLDRIAVRQGDVDCAGEVQEVAEFMHAGARLAYRCPDPIAAVEVEIAMLHDIHEAYRTFGIAASEATRPAQAVFSVAEPRHVMDFSGEGVAEEARGPLTGMAVLAALLLAGVAGGLAVVARRRA